MTDTIRAWIELVAASLPPGPVADLGGAAVHGGRGVRWCRLPAGCTVTTFDVVPYDGVDVVIEEGRIPEEHRGRYSYVAAIDCLQYAERPLAVFLEACYLLRPGGLWVATICRETCEARHTGPTGGPQDTGLRWDWELPGMALPAGLTPQGCDLSGHSCILWGVKP